MPIIVQSADEDSADEAALLARIVALETAVADLTATGTASAATITALQADATAATTALAAIQVKVALYDALVAALRDVLEAA